MLFGRRSFEVNKTVVIRDAIQVVDFPPWRQWLAVSLFPNIDMLKNIARFSSPRIAWFPQIDIAIRLFNSAAFRVSSSLTCPSTSSASNSKRRTKITTIKAWMFFLLVMSFDSHSQTAFPKGAVFAAFSGICAFTTKMRSFVFRFTTDWTRGFRFHNHILTERSCNIKIDRLMREKPHPGHPKRSL